MRARYLVLALCLLGVIVVVVPVIFVVVLSAARPAGQQPSVARAGVAVDRLPPLARSMLPLVNDRISKNCPELDAVRVLAEVQAESGWNPRAWSEDVNGGAAGLLQINQANWVGLGGRPWLAVPPTPDADIDDPSVHLTFGIDFLCANLRAMTAHLKQTGKTIDPMDAMSVCHIAGCGRVTGSRTGIPQAGEASCGTRCAELVSRYLNNIQPLRAGLDGDPGDTGTGGHPAIGCRRRRAGGTEPLHGRAYRVLRTRPDDGRLRDGGHRQRHQRAAADLRRAGPLGGLFRRAALEPHQRPSSGPGM